MNKTAITLGLALAVSGGTMAQDQLLFTTRTQASTLDALLPALRRVDPQDVMGVEPSALGPAVTATKHTPHDAWATLLGDHDLNGSYALPNIWGRIDALMARPTGMFGATTRDLYVSPSADTTSALSAYPTARMGDVVRIAPFGQFEPFLVEPRVIAAFGIVDPRVNVDAVAYDNTQGSGPPPGPGPAGVVFLSLEDDHVMQLLCGSAFRAMTVRDGSIIGAQVLGFDAQGAVLGRGFLVAEEDEVNGWVAASGLADDAGSAIADIVDLDGLAFDPRVGTRGFSSKCGTFPNLMFSGEAMTGGGVASTVGGGSIAQLNGADLGSAVVSDGRGVGLARGVGSLNGLEVRDGCRFVTETPTPKVGPMSTLEVEVGGAVPGTPVFMMFSSSIVACPVGGLATAGPWMNPCFPDLYQPLVLSFSLGAAAADGTQKLSVPIGGVGGSACLVFQAVNVVPGPTSATIHLSTPTMIELAP